MGQRKQAMAFGVAAVGFKGAEYLGNLIDVGCLPAEVFSYAQREEVANSFDKISKMTSQHGIRFHETKHPTFDHDRLLFFVGWQYLLNQIGDGFVVFHDSLLPKYRGFAPTVNALINGEPRIGVTAFIPDRGTDSGPIIGRSEDSVVYPIRIGQALRQQAGLMAQLTLDILARHKAGQIEAVAQDDACATYSVWRDQEDYRIDWNESAQTIKRTVDALSFPYTGATAMVDGHMLVIDEAAEVTDLTFIPRHPGKLWRFDEGRPVVICGRGLIRLDRVLSLNGEVYSFDRLRTRFQ